MPAAAPIASAATRVSSTAAGWEAAIAGAPRARSQRYFVAGVSLWIDDPESTYCPIETLRKNSRLLMLGLTGPEIAADRAQQIGQARPE